MLLFQKRQKVAETLQRENEMLFEKYNDFRRTYFMQMDSIIIDHKVVLKDKKSPRIRNGKEKPEYQEDTESDG